MGYDCTLHVVDEKQIKKALVSVILTGQRPAEIKSEYWDDALKSLAEDSPENVCDAVSQLALIFASKFQPYHYERGFALCLWPDQPDGLDAKFPRELTDSPEVLFEDLVKRHPSLKGKFPEEFSGNWSTGTFISSKKVGKALKWAESQVRKYGDGDQELFRGLLLVLRHCVKNKCAFWEGTDLPIPMAKMQVEGAQARRAASSFKWPDYGYEPLVQHDDLFICTYRLGPSKEARTALADFSSWPPQLSWLNEYAICAGYSSAGSLVTVATDPSVCSYTIRLRTSPKPESEIVILSGDTKALGPSGYLWAGFFRDQVVGLMWFKKDKTPKRYPQFQHGRVLRDDMTFPAARDNHKDHFGNESVRVGVARTADGSEVFVWRDGGYEHRNNRFQKTFSLVNGPGYDAWASVVMGRDGFYYLANRCLYEVHRGAASVRHLPKLDNIMHLRTGPQNSLLLKEGDNKSGDWGKLYWPESQQLVKLRPELLPDVPKRELRHLYWLGSQRKFLAFTDDSIWFIPLEEIEKLPRVKV